MQKFVAISWKMPEISAIENCALQKSGPKFTKNFRVCYPLRPSIMPNFIQICQTTLEIGVGRKKISTHRHTDTHGILTGWVASRSMREARLKTRTRSLLFSIILWNSWWKRCCSLHVCFLNQYNYSQPLHYINSYYCYSECSGKGY